MTSTLEKFVDIDNIPKKYGGNLDWNFGDMPYLEPEIAETMQWKETIEEKGHKTLPIGPLKLHYDDKDDLVATAIGTENSVPRSRIIAGLKPDPGVAKLALSAGLINPGKPDATATNANGAPVANGHPPDAKTTKTMNTATHSSS